MLWLLVHPSTELPIDQPTDGQAGTSNKIMGERLGLHNKNPKENSSQILIMETRYHNCHLWLWRNSFPSNIQVTEGGQGLNSCFDHKQHSSIERECPGSAPISRSYSELNLIKIIGLTNTHTHTRIHTQSRQTHTRPLMFSSFCKTFSRSFSSSSFSLLT